MSVLTRVILKDIINMRCLFLVNFKKEGIKIKFKRLNI